MAARSSRSRSRRSPVPKAPGVRWWAYALVGVVAVAVAALCIAALTHEFQPAASLLTH